ncbi:MAG: HAD-IB family phosphatase [Candidatus Gastranaerophilales bacterium]|nr:HAD-IB family phosphatase [Candidatus Gastranaerophilales bacterium]
MSKQINNKYVLVSDFDGTITKKDFFSYAFETILTKKDMKPWDDYKEGKISHVESLHRVFSKIHIKEQELLKLIDTMEFQDGFVETLNLCSKKQMGFHIVSAGADYYINRVLSRLDKQFDIPLLANNSSYSMETGLKLYPPQKDDSYFDSEVGVSKEKYVMHLKEQG